MPAQLAVPSSSDRMTQEEVPDGDDRSEFERDRDIILYSSAFKRLSGITQVVSAHIGHVFHNRLTHSLQVAQVGRSLVQKMKIRHLELAQALGLDACAVEAGCLAHDLGHPPFGHIAEEGLNRLAGEGAEGFEGNAQSFRIVSELAFRSNLFNGLNLTRATLRAILKYPWTYATRPVHDPVKRNKWGAYTSELRPFEFATGNAEGGPTVRSAEAELMDWADDLTYAVHDVEDFYRAAVIPLHRLRPSGKSGTQEVERERFLQYVWHRREKIPELKDITQDGLDRTFGDVLLSFFTIDTAYEGTRDQRARLRLFTSNLVGRYINGLKLKQLDDGEIVVDIDPGLKLEIAILKQLTWFYVIEASSLAVQQHAQKQLIRYLYKVFMQETKKSPSKLLPPYYRERLSEVLQNDGVSEPRVKRIVIDLIAGMTEAQAIAVYQRLNGIVIGSALDNILV
ncbi:MAG TPA: dNTP triphosphohydrolase [Terriglobia bacterium]|nr:dNTP triphosphohydrolase [Terriglobia bacterium]